jgi:hypothetical protein
MSRQKADHRIVPGQAVQADLQVWPDEFLIETRDMVIRAPFGSQWVVQITDVDRFAAMAEAAQRWASLPSPVRWLFSRRKVRLGR